ncbi:MAG TPA: peptidase S1 [Cyanobacteria bacterium UBA11369]|nr:peptidase S1 [Cyanobacteria bacterium UBA11371]HBE35941.1 peptidase S1 [Cyanobacteria bacterium UBA11368]HBE47876.1 peptidase S1 [Cyanobacteria bacterium UBA11369]
MDWRFLMLITCIGNCLMLPVQALPVNISAPATSQRRDVASLQQLAKAITVKVLSGDTWGSGILIRRQGQVYTVLTNDHVLTPGGGKSYRIQTPDGRIYSAAVLGADKFPGNDLGLLQFRSAATYRLASLRADSTPAVGDEVFAAGFPVETTGFSFTTGQISLLLDRALEGGYQIGYTNDIQKGMSGGPVLNRWGEVVGINAMHAYPLWGNPYVFKDGSVPSAAMQQQMIQLSWAVPVQTFLELNGRMVVAPHPVILEPKLPRLPEPTLLW